MPIAIGRLLLNVADGELDSMERYLGILLSSIREEANDLTARLNVQAAELPDSDRDEFFEYFSEDWQELSEMFPRLFMNSFFVTIISLAEHELKRIVKLAERKHRSHIGGFKKLSKMGTLESMGAYLALVPGLVFPAQNDAWKRLLTYNRVRNAIVHQHGEAGAGIHADALTFLKNEKAIAPRNTILLSEQICLAAIADVREVLKLVGQSLPPSLDI